MKVRRIPELDFFKGFAMVLVVCGHLILANWAGVIDNHPAYTWIYSFHMPLFFFISGFLIDHTLGNRSVWGGVKNKFLSLMIPFFVWYYIIAPFVVGQRFFSILELLTNTDAKYWFIYLLFIFSSFYYLGVGINRGRYGYFYGVLISLIILGFGQLLYPCIIFNRGLQFLPIYSFGVLASRFKLHEFDKLYSEPLLSIAFVVFMITSLSYCQLENIYLNKICKFVASFAICFLMLFYLNRRFLDPANKIVKHSMYIGKNSIVIYLTHFFFIKIVPVPIISEMSPSPFWVLIICILLSTIVITICLLIGSIVERFQWVNRLVYGRGW